jgi:hypothetical protein
MTKRGVLQVALVVALTVAIIWGAATWWTRPRVVEAGPVVVLMAGRDVGLGDAGIAGVGMSGTLGLVGDKCVGLLRQAGAEDGSVIVWPADTTVTGWGKSLSVTSEGVTYRIGQVIDGGTDSGTRSFPEFEGRLPDDCAGSGLLNFYPNH